MSTDMSTEKATPAPPLQRSTLNLLSVLCLCLTSAFLTASVVLIFQYQKGVPFSLTVSLLLAAAAALLVPFLATLFVSKFRANTRYGRYAAFIISNLIISTVTGLLIF